jgi:hypothetical protein
MNKNLQKKRTMKNNKTDATKVLKFFREAREARRGGEIDPPKQTTKTTKHLGSLDDPIKRPGYDFVRMNGNTGRWVKKEFPKKTIKGDYSVLKKNK